MPEQLGTLPLETSEFARRIRLHALRMTSVGGSSHIGAVLSMADIMAVLYGGGVARRSSAAGLD